MRAKLAVVLAVLAVVLAGAGPAGADPSGLINRAHVHTNSRHPEGSRLAWSLAQVRRPAIVAINTAKATAHHCDGCQAEAVAFQIVLASDTQVYVLTNNATSINTECESCTALTVAEQWVAGATNGTVVLSQAGQSALEAVQAQLASDVAQGPQAGTQAILGAADEVSAILSADLTVVPNKAPPGPALPEALVTTTDLTNGPGVTTLYAQPPGQPLIQHYAQVSG
jgi:hypothetical protein